MTDTALPRADRPERRLNTRRKLTLSKASLIAATTAIAAGVAGSAFSPNPGLVLACAFEMAFILVLLWQENEPPLLLFPAMFQWLAVSTKPLMSVFLHEPVNAMAEFDINIEPGVVLGLFAVAALALGMRLGLGRASRDWNAALKNEAQIISPRSALRVAIGAILFGHLLFFLMRFSGPASQLFYAMANIRFAGIFALAYWCFINRRGFAYLGLVLAIEIVIGITGFFSDFRAPIFIIAFAAFAAGHRPKLRDSLFVGGLAAMLLVFGSFWSEVKLDYRHFVSGGTNEQVIVVPLQDRIDYLVSEVKTFDRTEFADGFDKLLRRQSYIDFLAAVVGYVPQTLPHEHGARVGMTIVHILTPRILFPDKPPTEFDSEVTAHYSGLPLQIRDTTSISIGYVGELYIDFGSIGAVIGCLVLGWGFGLAYRLLRQGARGGSLLLTYGVRSTVLVVILPFETALVKYVGGVTIAYIAAYLLQRYLVPYLSRQLKLNRKVVARLQMQGLA